MARSLLQCALAMALVFVDGPFVAGDTIEDVLAAWRARRKQFEAIRFEYSGTEVITPGVAYLPAATFGNPEGGVAEVRVPPQELTHTVQGTLLIDFSGGRIRRDHKGMGPSVVRTAGTIEYFPRDETATFDGQLYRFYLPRESNQDLGPNPGASEPEYYVFKNPRLLFMKPEYNALLLACGMMFTPRSRDFLDQYWDPREFVLEGEVTVEDRAYHVLRTTPGADGRFYEYKVERDDPRRIRQFTAFHWNRESADEEISLSSDISYRKTTWGPLPDRWTSVRYDILTGAPQTQTLHLDKFEVNPVVDDNDFAIPPPVGTRVQDETRGEGDQEYVVAAAGEPELPVSEVILQEQARSRTWLYMGLLGIVIIVGGVVIFLNRRT